MSTLKPQGAATLLGVACLTIMVGCVLVPGLPAIAAATGVAGSASWLITLPSLGVVLFGPFVGAFIGRTGARTMLCLGLLLYGLLGMLGAVTHGAAVVFADRLLLGGATTMVMAAGTALISDFYAGQERLLMIARQGMAIELGGVVLLAVGGLLATLGWRWPFLLYGLAWLLLIAVLAFIPAGAPHAAEPEQPETAPRPRVWDIYCAAMVSMIVFFTAIILLPARLTAIGLGEDGVGYLLSFVSLVAVAAAFVMPQLLTRVGGPACLALGFLGYAAAHATFLSAGSLTGFVLGGVALGIGFGLTIPLANHLVIERSPPRQRGHLLAYLSVAIFLGQFLSSFLDLLPGGAAMPFAAALGCAVAMVLAYGGHGLLSSPGSRGVGEKT